MEALLTVQKVRLQNRTLTPEQEMENERLLANVPVMVLEKFNRFISRGKKGVATVRNGVCGECHLQLPSGTLAGMAYTTEVHHCDNCGRFLYLPQNEPLGITNALTAKMPLLQSPPSASGAGKSPARKPKRRASVNA